MFRHTLIHHIFPNKVEMKLGCGQEERNYEFFIKNYLQTDNEDRKSYQ